MKQKKKAAPLGPWNADPTNAYLVLTAEDLQTLTPASAIPHL